MVTDDDQRARELTVLGGTGFLGRAYVTAALRRGRRVRMLVRDPTRGVASVAADAVERVAGDFTDAGALRRLIRPGSTVVNFAWGGQVAPQVAIEQARQLAAICREHGAAALLHCSTASVYGGCADAGVIRDDTPPRAADEYGRVKLAIDDVLQQELEGRLPLALLRPTAVFGPGGLGLVKMLSEVVSGGSGPASYLRSCLFRDRLMHLVPVETVVEAFFFVEPRVGLPGCRHIIAADHEPLNRYDTMERHLKTLFNPAHRPWPRLPLPAAVLRLALRAGGRTAALPFTLFDHDGLRAMGFTPPVAFASAVDAFAAWYAAQQGVELPIGRAS